jgi:hypothetical protein
MFQESWNNGNTYFGTRAAARRRRSRSIDDRPIMVWWRPPNFSLGLNQGIAAIVDRAFPTAVVGCWLKKIRFVEGKESIRRRVCFEGLFPRSKSQHCRIECPRRCWTLRVECPNKFWALLREGLMLQEVGAYLDAVDVPSTILYKSDRFRSLGLGLDDHERRHRQASESVIDHGKVNCHQIVSMKCSWSLWDIESNC